MHLGMLYALRTIFISERIKIRVFLLYEANTEIVICKSRKKKVRLVKG